VADRAETMQRIEVVLGGNVMINGRDNLVDQSRESLSGIVTAEYFERCDHS
jgi:hypothetical protein